MDQGERANLHQSELQRLYQKIVINCHQCNGTGKTTKALMKFLDDDISKKIKKEETEHSQNLKENPNNSSYGLCECQIRFEWLKTLLIGGVPIDFEQFPFDNIVNRDITIENIGKIDIKKFLKLYSKKFDEAKSNAIGINISGKFGTGKTYFSQFLASKIAQRRYSIHYIPLFLLIKIYEESNDLMKEIMNVDFLAIDEIGSEHPYKRQYCGEISFFLKKRLLFHKPTMYVFNDISKETIIENYGNSFYSCQNERNMNVFFSEKVITNETTNKFIKRFLNI